MGTFSGTAREIMRERFGHDALISLATVEGAEPRVRTVDGYYEDGCFYVITHLHSGKMKQIEMNPAVAVCGDWFTAQGFGECLGHVCDPKNIEMAGKLRAAFARWYGNGHVDESDPGTCILRIRLSKGVLFSHGTRHDIDSPRSDDIGRHLRTVCIPIAKPLVKRCCGARSAVGAPASLITRPRPSGYNADGTNIGIPTGGTP